MVFTVSITTTTEAVMATDIQDFNCFVNGVFDPRQAGWVLARFIRGDIDGSIQLVKEPKRYVAQWREGVCLLVPGICTYGHTELTLAELCGAFIANTIGKVDMDGTTAVDGYGVWWDHAAGWYAVSANTSFNSRNMASRHCVLNRQQSFWDRDEHKIVKAEAVVHVSGWTLGLT